MGTLVIEIGTHVMDMSTRIIDMGTHVIDTGTHIDDTSSISMTWPPMESQVRFGSQISRFATELQDFNENTKQTSVMFFLFFVRAQARLGPSSYT
jgi:hypothetical protein